MPGEFPDNRFAHIKRLKEELEKAKKIKWIKDNGSYESLIKEMRDEELIKDEIYKMMKVHLLYLSRKK